MLPALGLDEMRVVERQIEKMLRARDQYGELHLDRDHRDFMTEAAEEHRDAVFYLLVDELVRNDQRLERLRCEAADELAHTNPVEHGLREFVKAAPPTPPAPDFDSPFEIDPSGEGP